MNSFFPGGIDSKAKGTGWAFLVLRRSLNASGFGLIEMVDGQGRGWVGMFELLLEDEPLRPCDLIRLDPA
jgi:hypothetical protein